MSNRLSGALVLAFGNAVKTLVQFALIPILARILGPQSYGLVGLAIPFIFFVNLFADAGMEKAVARVGGKDRVFVSTAFWLSGFLGLALALVIAAISGVMTLSHMGRSAAPILLGLAPILVLSSLCAAPNGVVIHEGRFKIFATADIVSTLVSSAVAVALALHHFGVWAIVLQQNLLWASRLAIIFTLSGLRPDLSLSLPSVAPHLGFALRTLGVGIVDFFSRNIDNLLIGWMLGAASLGVYAMSYQLIRAPEMLVAGPIYASLFSAFVASSGDVAALAATYKQAMRVVLMISAPMLVGLALVGRLALPIILGAKWTATVIIVQLLAPAGVALCLFTVVGALLVGVGRPQNQLRNSLWMAGATICGIVVGAMSHSSLGVAAGVSVGMSLALWIALASAASVTATRVSEILWVLRGPVAGIVAMCAVTWLATPYVLGWSAAAQLGGLIVLNIAAYGATLYGVDRHSVRSDLANLAALTHRRRAAQAPA